MLNVSSGSSVWSMINQAQLYFLLLLTRAYIPDDVKLVITGLKFALNPFFYFSLNTMSAYNSAINNFNFELSNYSLSYVGVNSDSSVYNTAPFFVFMLIAITLHLFVIIFRRLFEKCSTDWASNWFIKTLKWITEKLYRILTFGYYIRAALEMNQYFLICSVYEVYMFDTSQPFIITSLVFALLVLIGWILIEVIAFSLSISSYATNESKHNKLGELFIGLKMNKRFKLSIVMLIFRRAIFIILLLTWVSVTSRLLIGVLAFLQLIYLSYICYLRPFKEFKDNLIEIMNETCFLLLLSALILFNTKDNWSAIATTIYMWVIQLTKICNNNF